MMFRDHFGSFLNLARIRLVQHFITAASKVRTVNYSKLSAGFLAGADALSNYRRIQRFMAGAALPMEWVARFIFALLPLKGPLVLVMDRTNWKLGESWHQHIDAWGGIQKRGLLPDVPYAGQTWKLQHGGTYRTGQGFHRLVRQGPYRLPVGRPGVCGGGLDGLSGPGEHQVPYPDQEQFQGVLSEKTKGDQGLAPVQ